MQKTRQFGLSIIVLVAAAILFIMTPAAFAGDNVVDVEGHGVGYFTGMAPCSETYEVCGPCLDGSCMVQFFSGTGVWQHIGSFEWDANFVVNPATATPNLFGGYCFQATAESYHQTTNGMITLRVIVDLCEIGGGEMIFNGAYSIIDGTEHYLNTSGNGSIAGGLNQNTGRMLVNIDGTLVKD